MSDTDTQAVTQVDGPSPSALRAAGRILAEVARRLAESSEEEDDD